MIQRPPRAPRARPLLPAVVLAFVAATMAPAAVGAVLVLTEPTQAVPVRGPQLEILEDPTAELTIEDVTAAPSAARFVPSARPIPNLGYSRSAFWARLGVRNATGATGRWRLVLGNARIDHVDFYVAEAGRPGLEHQVSGRLQPFVQRGSPHRYFVLDLPLGPGAEKQVYVRIAGTRSMSLPLVLQPADRVGLADQTEYWLLGLLYGALLVMLGYNLFLFVSLREASYLYLVLLILAHLLFRLDYDGLLTQLVVTRTSPQLLGVPLWAPLSLFAFLGFTIAFLRTAQRAPRLHRLLRVMQLTALGFVLALGIFPVLIFLVPSLSTITLPAVALTGYLVWRGGFSPARVFLFAVVLVTLTYFLLSAMHLGWLPPQVWLEYAGHLSMVVLVLLLSLAQADHINRLRLETDNANAALRESERRLEGQVQERTVELAGARDRAESANRAKSELLANVSHELRTPLNAVLGFASLLRRRERSPEKLATLEAIETSGITLLRLADDILDLSKVEAGKLDLRLGPVDLRALAGELEFMYGRPIADKGLTFRVSLDPDVPQALELDGVRVRQVLANLLGNAMKFTQRGEIELGASVTPAGGEDLSLAVWVRDTGVGISPEGQAEVFEPFGQLDRGKGVGAGLGLTISRRLARLMGGEILVASAAGAGSTFTLHLPRVRRATAPASPPPMPTDAGPRDFAPARILIADDESLNRRLLLAYLAEGPFELLEAADGGRALEIARRERPDLVLLDMVMPVMDGIAVARALKADADTRATAVIAVTADAVSPRAELAAEVCDALLTKPLTRPALIAAMGRLLPRASAGGLGGEPPREGDSGNAQRDLPEAILAAEAAYRLGLAARLHDAPLQTLAAAQIGAEMAAADPAVGDPAEVARLIARAIGELRILLFDLSVDRLLDQGLDEALDSLAWHLTGRFGTAFEYRCDRPPELSAVAVRLLFMSLIELLRGVERIDGGAIEVCGSEGAVSVELRLEGAGIGAASIRPADAQAIERRMALVGGRVRVEGLENRLRVGFHLPSRTEN